MKDTKIRAVIRYMRGGAVEDCQLNRDYFTRSRMATLGRKLETLQSNHAIDACGAHEGAYILWLCSSGAEIPLRRGDWLQLLGLILSQLERSNLLSGGLNTFSAMVVRRIWKTVEHLHHSQK